MPPSSVTLRLPVPPSANNLYLNNSGSIAGRGRRKGAIYAAWLHEAGIEINRQTGKRDATWQAGKLVFAPLIAGIVAVDVRAPLNRRRDLDNALKGLLDLIVKMHVIADDNLIDDLRIRRAGTGNKLTIEIRSMEALDGKHVAA